MKSNFEADTNLDYKMNIFVKTVGELMGLEKMCL